MRGLAEHVYIVTGAGAGIGRATALRLADEGAQVLITDRDREAAERVVSEAEGRGGRARAHRVDVGEPEQVAQMVEACLEEFGRIDGLANNAGVAIPGAVVDLTIAEWDALMNINLRSMWLAMKAVIPHLTHGGAIVNMSSGQAKMGFPGWAGYAATKGGIIALTQQAAVEYARQGVRVNAVAPGTIMTPMNEKIFDEAPDRDALVTAWGRQHALGRFGQPEEVASVIAFLLSDESSFMTGACLPVDGGMTILGPTTD